MSLPIFISHRGNIFYKNPPMENSPHYILEALSAGYNVEIDVWYDHDKYYLGHDSLEYDITSIELKIYGYTMTLAEILLTDNRIWCHAKTINTFNKLIELNSPNCFFHDVDAATLTNSGYIWTYPGKNIYKNNICVLPESVDDELYTIRELNDSAGICSDNIENYKKQILSFRKLL